MGSNYGLDRDFGSSRVKVRTGSVREPGVVTGGFMGWERKLECQGWPQGSWPDEKVGIKESTQQGLGTGHFAFLYCNYQ